MKSNFLEKINFFKVMYFEIIKYGLSGFLRSFVTIFIYNLLLMHLNYILSHLVSIMFSIFMACAINIRFVFNKRITRRRILYQLLIVSAYIAISTFFLFSFVSFGISPRYSQLLSILILFMPFFLISKYFST